MYNNDYQNLRYNQKRLVKKLLKSDLLERKLFWIESLKVELGNGQQAGGNPEGAVLPPNPSWLEHLVEQHVFNVCMVTSVDNIQN